MLHDPSVDEEAAAASAGGTALVQQAAAVPAPAPAPVQPVSVAQRYRDALPKAGLPLGHVFDFGHARQFVFANVESDGRRGARADRDAGATVVSDAAPAVVRFVELGGQFVVACGCSPQAHNESLLDMCVAESEVAGDGGAAGSGDAPAPPQGGPCSRPCC